MFPACAPCAAAWKEAQRHHHNQQQQQQQQQQQAGPAPPTPVPTAAAAAAVAAAARLGPAPSKAEAFLAFLEATWPSVLDGGKVGEASFFAAMEAHFALAGVRPDAMAGLLKAFVAGAGGGTRLKRGPLFQLLLAREACLGCRRRSFDAVSPGCAACTAALAKAENAKSKHKAKAVAAAAHPYAGREQLAPEAAVVVAADGAVSEPVSGTFSCTRLPEGGGAGIQAALDACPEG